MKLEVFAVHDNAVGAYLQPFFCRSKAEAIRSFSDAVNGDTSPFSKHSIDFTLVYMGSFDDSGGFFSTVDPVRILGASEVRLEPEPDRLGSYTPQEGFPKRKSM